MVEQGCARRANAGVCAHMGTVQCERGQTTPRECVKSTHMCTRARLRLRWVWIPAGRLTFLGQACRPAAKTARAPPPPPGTDPALPLPP